VVILPEDVSQEEEPAWIAAKAPASVVVVDSYAIDESWEAEVSRSGSAVVVIDDMADRPHAASILLNQNLGSSASEYRNLVGPSCALLVGPEYALVRPEFARFRSVRSRTHSPVKRVLVFLSGGDEHDISGLAARATADLGLEVDVVVGGAYPHFSALTAWAQGREGVRILRNVTDMAELMFAADVSIGAPSSASWERCCVGLPTLMIGLAENQRRVAAELVARGAAELIGWYDTVSETDIRTAVRTIRHDPGRLAAMSQAAREITDGQGANRVADAIMRLVG
jgi:UDP-2,4-diacetamido-2,4,6-trideoxy-beta-L-altropyranose hydrolase